MKNFIRVLAVAFQDRKTICIAIICSLCVGVLWSTNIGTIYPVMKIVFYGQSIEGSMELQLNKSKENLKNYRDSVNERENNDKIDKPESKEQLTIEQLESSIAVEEKSIAQLEFWLPLAKKWLPSTPFATMGLVVSFLLLGTIMRGICLAVQEIAICRLSQSTLFHLQQQLYSHCLDADLLDLENDRASKLLSHFTHDIRRLGTGIRDVFGPLMREPLKILACLIAAALVSWQLLIISLLISPLAILLVRGSNLAMKRMADKSLSAVSDIYSHLSESFNSIRVIRSFSLEQSELAIFEKKGMDVYDRAIAMVKIRAWIKPISELISFCIVAVALMLGTHFVVGGKTELFGIQILTQRLSPEALILFFGFMLGLTDPIQRLSGVSTRVSRTIAAADRFYKRLERLPRIKSPEQPIELTQWQQLDFDQVSFNYAKDKPVLNSVSFSIPANSCVALVGPNGSGKSTIIDLAARFIDPKGGKIRLNGNTLKEYSLEQLRSKIALVSQKTRLFDETILENIRRGKPTATDQEVFQAAIQADADHFITTDLADGYETIVGEDANFVSGGQAQRIALARAILRDPEFLILDEPTSSIDVEGEKSLLKSLTEFVKTRSTLLVTHRPELISLADYVVVIDSGEVIAHGTYHEVIQHSAFLQSLCNKGIRNAA